LRDDILTALASREALKSHDYEERVAALRSQMDRIGTEKLLQQRDVRQKVSELLEKQDLLAQRQERFGPFSSRLMQTQITTRAVPLPTPRPAYRAEVRLREDTEPQTFRASAYASEGRLDVPWPLRTSQDDVFSGPRIEATDEADLHSFLPLEQSLEDVKQKQLEQVSALTAQAYLAADSIENVLE